MSRSWKAPRIGSASSLRAVSRIMVPVYANSTAAARVAPSISGIVISRPWSWSCVVVPVQLSRLLSEAEEEEDDVAEAVEVVREPSPSSPPPPAPALSPPQRMIWV